MVNYFNLLFNETTLLVLDMIVEDIVGQRDRHIFAPT